jgi:ABC-type transporter Mla subunit MlaD
MTSEERLAVRVGAGMMVAIALGVAWLLVIGDISLRRHVGVRVTLSHVGGLHEGAAVQTAGRVIGEIRAIELAREGGVVLHAQIEQRYASMCPTNGDWFVNSKGIFGERYLEVGPPHGDVDWARTIRDGDEITGIDPPQLDRLAAMSMRNITTMRMVTDELMPEARELGRALDDTSRILDEIEPNPGRFAQSYAAGKALVGESRESIAFWEDTGTSVDDITALADKTRATLSRAGDQIGDLRARVELVAARVDGVRDKLDPDRLANFERALAESRDVLARMEAGFAVVEEMAAIVESGQGTIGGFMNDIELRDFAKRMQRIIKRQGWEVIGHPKNRDLKF